MFVEGPLARLYCPYGAANLLTFRMCPMPTFKCKVGKQPGQTVVLVEGNITILPYITVPHPQSQT